MRLCISLHSNKGQRLPLSHLDLLRQTLRERADVDISNVSFSDLRVPSHLRAIDGEREELCIDAGDVQWWLAAPRARVVHELADIFSEGGEISIGDAQFTVRGSKVVHLPAPLATADFYTSARFSCWTPIVARVIAPTISHIPFFASPIPNDMLFAERIRTSLVEKYAAMYGCYPKNRYLYIGFDQNYIRRHPRRGAKRIVSDGRPVTGVLAPFVLRGSAELLRTAWECGIGDLTEEGFGFVEVLR